MNIECGEYTLKSDPMNFWIERKVTSKKSGNEYGNVVTGYCQDIPHLLKNFTERRFRGSYANTMTDMLHELQIVETELMELADSLGKEFEEVKP